MGGFFIICTGSPWRPDHALRALWCWNFLLSCVSPLWWRDWRGMASLPVGWPPDAWWEDFFIFFLLFLQNTVHLMSKVSINKKENIWLLCAKVYLKEMETNRRTKFEEYLQCNNKTSPEIVAQFSPHLHWSSDQTHCHLPVEDPSADTLCWPPSSILGWPSLGYWSWEMC